MLSSKQLPTPKPIQSRIPIILFHQAEPVPPPPNVPTLFHVSSLKEPKERTWHISEGLDDHREKERCLLFQLDNFNLMRSRMGPVKNNIINY